MCIVCNNMKNTHQSLGRALDILMAFIPNNQELRASEVGELVGIHRSTAVRLLQVLAQYRFLRQDPVTKKYSLGESAVSLGRAVVSSLESKTTIIARPYIDALRDHVGENVALEVLSGNSTILVYVAKGPGKLQVSFQIGDQLPMHVAAGGKAILAFLPGGASGQMIPETFERYTPNTITDKKRLLQQLSKIRESGIAFDEGERDIDVHVAGAPVFNDKEEPVAAVVVVVPVTRKERLASPEVQNLLKKTAAAISEQLLYKPID